MLPSGLSECGVSVLNHDVRFVPVLKDWHCSSILFELACRQPVMLEDGKASVWDCWL